MRNGKQTVNIKQHIEWPKKNPIDDSIDDSFPKLNFFFIFCQKVESSSGRHQSP